MRFGAGLLALAAAALPSLLDAQTKPPAAPAPLATPPAAPVPLATPPSIVIGRITVADLKKELDADKVLVLDVRSAEAYRESHIAGSISVPLAELDKHVEKLKAAKKPLVTYCTWTAEATSARAALKLNTAGLPGVRALLGGFAKWQEAGHPVAHGDSPR